MGLMSQRLLGSSGISVSCLGLGTVKLGRNQGVKYPVGFRLPEDREVIELLSLARSLGINLLDTAPAYGNSEERLGRLLTRREDWILCSKVGEEFVAGKSHFDFSAAHTIASVERSLRRLRTDHLDLVMIHSDGNDLAVLRQTDCLEALQRCQERGLLRAVGMSTKTVAGGLAAAAACDAVMVSYNPAHQHEAIVIDAARRHGCGVLVKKALDSGHACNAGHNLRFALGHPGVSSVVVGTINPAHLQANVAALSGC